ncbi:MAG: isochorismatase family protein, partial [Proteobacteria bacterium]|nr:isochorismatase family protein [Pseudomonadota bacterium]
MTDNVVQLPDCMIDPPLLIAIDIQREYTTEGRPYFINGVEPSVKNCQRVLEHARAQRWPVAHIRHLQSGHVFNETMAYSRFVEGFEPLPHEFVFTKNNFSCYTNTAFAELLESARRGKIYVIGYNSLMCCLSTIIEG